MNPSDPHDPAELERRLRDAFAAKALQVSDADLDPAREAEVVAVLEAQRRRHPATRWFAGIGSAAAAAAIIGVALVGLHDGNTRQVVNGLPPAVTTTSSSPGSSTVTGPSSSSTGELGPDLQQPATPGNGRTSTLSSVGSSGGQSTVPTSDASTSPDVNRTALSHGSTGGSAQSSLHTSAAQLPPAMPSELPQSGSLGDQDYTGAVPLVDPSGGPARMLSMPSDLTWQRTAHTDHTLTVRITYLPTDIEAYWRGTLPAQGWVADGAGWKFPGTSYAVSPISDKGSFTVTW